MAANLTPLRFVKTVLNSFLSESGLETRLFRGNVLRIVDAKPGVVKFELTISQYHTNRLHILHGGTIAALVDLGGSLAVASKGHYMTGVSTDMNITYLKTGGRKWGKLHATAMCQRIGKTLAYTTVNFWDDKRKLVARGSHTKFVAQAVADSEPYTVPERAQMYIPEETDAPIGSPSVSEGGEQDVAEEAAATEVSSTEEASTDAASAEESATEEPSTEEPTTVPGGGEASTVPEGADQSITEGEPAPKP